MQALILTIIIQIWITSDILSEQITSQICIIQSIISKNGV